MKEKVQAPELRFDGFTDDWEERKLLDNVEKVLDYRGKSPAKFGMEWGTEGYLVLSALNVKNGYIDKSVEAKYGDHELFDRWMGNNRLEKGDVVFTTEAPLGNVAQVPDNNGYILNQRAVAFKSLQETDDNFFAQLLRSPIVQNTLKASSSGGTAKGIGMKEFAKLNARVPETHEEQRKIGLFFKQLDDTIVLHQRKLDLLKEQKKGYLQKMFPKNGSKIPELRFAEFADDWEERKLGEVATFLNGRAYKQDELLDSGKYKVLRVGNFYTNDSWYYSNMELGDKYYVDKGDLVYTWSATFGPHIWSGEKVIYHYHIWKVELSKFLDRNFTLQLLEADKARLLSSTNGSTMIHVTKGDMESKIVSIPNIDEQKQIGSFFKQLDNTITLHQRKLDLLKEQKKGYLQKMFV